MARFSLSTSPPGSSRRLSELLEEQQEPFSLDLYLLDKGCSPTLVDAAGGSSAGATSTCWPRSRRTFPALRRMVASRKTRGNGILGLLLSKVLHGTATAAAKKKNKKKLHPAAIDWGSVDGEKTPGNLRNAVASSRPRTVQADTDETGEDDESSEQLSPVSVLEQRPFEQAPPAYAKKAIIIIRELLDAAYKPTLLDQLSKDSSNNKSKDGYNDTPTATTTAAPAPAPMRTGRATSDAHWEEMFEAELAKVHDLIASDMAAGARVGPEDVRSGRWDVGTELAVAMLEALTEEIVVELVGMDRDDAIDNGGRSCC